MCDSLSSLANLGQILEKFRPRLFKRDDAEDVLSSAFLAARHRWPAVQVVTDLWSVQRDLSGIGFH